jgi:ABC-type multidrug transport system ATPase subunit
MTCLNALLGRVPISSGSILINHQHTVQEVLALNVVGYVPQSDVMLPMLTVRELLVHSALMRLPSDWSKEAKLARVAATMELLGITHLADVVVGDESSRSLSGGEKKRTSIGLELVSDPQILLLDEPTTGLDSANSLQVVKGLTSVAAQGKVVACVVHQPRWEIFSLFSDVLLLARGGVTVYWGPVSGVGTFFARMGFIPPPNTNPADFYIDVITDEEFLQAWNLGGEAELRQRAIAAGKLLPEVIEEENSMSGGGSSSSTGNLSAHQSHISNHRLRSETDALTSNGGIAVPADATAPGSVVRFHLSAEPALDNTSAEKRNETTLSNVDHSSADPNAAGAGAIELAPVQKTASVSAPIASLDSVSIGPTVLASGSVSNSAAQTDAISSSTNVQLKPVLAKLASYTSEVALAPVIPASFLLQTRHLLWRFLLCEMRDGSYVFWDSLLQIIPAVSLSLVSLNKDTYAPPLPQPVADTCINMISTKCQDQTSDQGFLVNATFFYTMIIGVGAMLWSVNAFARRMNIFNRDRLAGMSVGAYALARCIYDLLHWTRMALIFTSIFYLMASPRGGITFWFVTVWLTFFASGGLGYFIGCCVKRGATTIGIVAAVAGSVTSGLLPTLKVVSDWNILRVFWYLSYNRWSAESMVILNNTDQPTGGRMEHVISAAGYDADNLSVDLALVLVIGLLWRIATYIVLQRSKSHTAV